MSTGWNETDPSPLGPLSLRQKVRLILRGAWAALWLFVLFALFLLVRLGEATLGRLSGRSHRRTSNHIVRLWAGLALPTLGLRYVETGSPIRGKAGAIVANHSSWIDIIALQRAAAPHLVSKAEVRDWPGIGLIGRAIGTLFIDRRSSAARRHGLDLHARIREGDLMAIFPEGTSTDGTRVLPFKSSLFGVFLAPDLEGRTWIQPVAISYAPPRHLPASFYGWWGDMDFAGHLVSVLARSHGGTVRLSFLDAIPMTGALDRKEVARRCSEAVRRAFEGARGAGQSPADGSNRSATPFMQ
jgi:lyso-ornithine lipid O-acyltransferase